MFLDDIEIEDDMPCDFDHMTFFDGGAECGDSLPAPSALGVFARVCGGGSDVDPESTPVHGRWGVPFPGSLLVLSTGQDLFVKFNSDESVVGQGYRATWTVDETLVVPTASPSLLSSASLSPSPSLTPSQTPSQSITPSPSRSVLLAPIIDDVNKQGVVNASGIGSPRRWVNGTEYFTWHIHTALPQHTIRMEFTQVSYQ
jgi:hypothetical protein